jgi:hypothetical protein
VIIREALSDLPNRKRRTSKAAQECFIAALGRHGLHKSAESATTLLQTQEFCTNRDKRRTESGLVRTRRARFSSSKDRLRSLTPSRHGLLARGSLASDLPGGRPMECDRQYRDPLPPNEQEPSAEDWKATIDRLQELVCVLLLKNESMRIALSIEKKNHQHSEAT